MKTLILDLKAPEHTLRQAALGWAKAYYTNDRGVVGSQAFDVEDMGYIADEVFLFVNAHEGRLPNDADELDQWLAPVPAGWDRIEGGTDQ